MENSSKALIIAGAILLSILIISIGIYIYNSATSTTSDIVIDTTMKMQLMQFNKQYEMYEGIQSGSNIKSLLNLASQNNRDLYKYSDTIKLCVCIRSKSNTFLNRMPRTTLEDALKNREYGVRYPNIIKEVSNCVSDNDKYNIELEYNEYGYVWEIWINDIE